MACPSILSAVSGKGIETGEDGGEIVVAWSAKVASAGPVGAEYEHLYRAIRVSLEGADYERVANGNRQIDARQREAREDSAEL
jgi:hypothetical protein